MNCPTCNLHIDEHPANACLNEWIAADIMGEEKPSIEHDHLHLYSINSEGGNWYCLCEYDKGDTCIWYAKNFSGYIGVAWWVLERLEELEPGSIIRVSTGDGDSCDVDILGRRPRDFGGKIDSAHAMIDDGTLKDAPLAICRVAIKARLQGVSE